MTAVGSALAASVPPTLLVLATLCALVVAVGRSGRRRPGAAAPTDPAALAAAGARAAIDGATRRRRRRFALLGCVAPLTLLGACCGILAAATLGPTEVYEIPAGYRGWLVIRYEDPTCGMFRTSANRRYIAFDDAGRACTAGRDPGKWRGVEFVYVAPDGGRVAIPTAPPGFTAGASANSAPPPGVHADLFGGSGDGRETTAFVAAAPDDLPLLQYTNPVGEADTRAIAVRAAMAIARQRGAADPRIDVPQLGMLGAHRGAMSPTWNAALGAFIAADPARTTGYARLDGETPTWLVRVRGVPGADCGLLLLVDARNGRPIGADDPRAAP